MTSRHPSSPAPQRTARALRVWVSILVAIAVFLVVLLSTSWWTPAEKALRQGRKLLADGQNLRAAEQFELAIKLDPDMTAAWHGLLRATPTPSVCRRFARRFPEVFDPRQPVQDETLLVRGRGWDEALWNDALTVYETALSQLPAEGAGPDAELLRLDGEGRQEVTETWNALPQLQRALHAHATTPFSTVELRPFSARNLPEVRRLIWRGQDRFASQEQWAELHRQAAQLVKAGAAGVAKLEHAAEIDPLHVPTQLTLAYIDIVRRRYAQAEARCRNLLAASSDRNGIPGEIRIRYCLARVLELTDRWTSAAAQVRRIHQKRPKDVSATLRLAALYLQLDHVDKANQLADEILEGSPDDTRPSYVKGVACLRRGEFDMAVAKLTVACEQNPRDLAVHYYLARAKLAAGSYQAAYGDFIDLAKKAPDPGWPLIAACAAALEARQWGTAQRVADELLTDERSRKEHPQFVIYALRFKAAAAAMQAQAEVANQAAREYADLAGNKELADYLLAGIWAGQAYVMADTDMQIKDQWLTHFRTEIAVDQMNRRLFHPAMETLRQVLREEPENVKALILRGRCCVKTRQFAKARQDFEAALRLDPTLPAARLGLAEVTGDDAEERREVDDQGALDPAQQSAAPGRPSAKYCLAFLLAAKGDTAAARTTLEEVNAETPDYLLAALHLARLYLLEGKTARAARVLERTGKAKESPSVARALAVIPALQGLKVLHPPPELTAAPNPDDVVGPHLALFGVAVHDDEHAYAQRVLLLDPVAPFTHDLLRLAYPHIRKQGLPGIAAAAQADPDLDQLLKRGLARYHAVRNGLCRLAVGNFWDELPPSL